MSIIEKAIGKHRENQPGAPAERPKPRVDAGGTPGDQGQRARASNASLQPPEPITIDLARLRQQGVWPPASMERRLRDEFRRIKRPLLANATGRGTTAVDRGHLIVVTSSQANEGKTFTSLNLALSIAQEVDFEIVLVDGDVAKRTASELLGLADSPGLTDLLDDPDLRPESVVVPTSIPTLSVMPAGRPHSLSVELLSSTRMYQIADALSGAQRNRIVLFDSPPLLLAPESTSLCALAGQVAMVVKAGGTLRQNVLTALDQVDPSKAINMILNKSLHSEHGEYYGAYYGYGGES